MQGSRDYFVPESFCIRDNKYLDDGLSGYYIFGEVLESTGFEYPNVSIVITNDSDDQSVVTPAGMSDIKSKHITSVSEANIPCSPDQGWVVIFYRPNKQSHDLEFSVLALGTLSITLF